MKFQEFIRHLFDRTDKRLLVDWRLDPSEGIDFFLPEELKKRNRSYSENDSFALLQWAALRSAEEDGKAIMHYSGYTILSDDFVQFENDFYKLFDFPPRFDGHIDFSFSGNTTQAIFKIKPIIVMPDGDRIPQFLLEGPFLRLGNSERYRLEKPVYFALKSVVRHSNLSHDQRTEYENGKMILSLKEAQAAGARLHLAHFENMEVISPKSVGLSVRYETDGGLKLSPTIGVDVSNKDLEPRWAQLDSENVQALRVRNNLVILKPEARNAIMDILSNRIIPKDRVADFISNPAAFVDAALVDLDTGFSLRAHGAERFELRYFGETESETQDWFDSADTQLRTLQQLLYSTESESAINDIKEKVEHAVRHGATIIEFEGEKILIHVHDESDPVVACAERKLEFKNEKEADEIDQNTSDLERAVIAIDDNDEETLFSGMFNLDGFDESQHQFDEQLLLRAPLPHQEEGIHWLLAHLSRAGHHEGRGALLADDMGLGKTFMALVCISERIHRIRKSGGKQKPHLVVAPLSLLSVWHDEIALTFKKSPFADVVTLQSGGDLIRFLESGAGTEIRQQIGESGRIDDIRNIRHSLKVGAVYGSGRLDMPERLVLTTYQTLRNYQFSMARIDWGIVTFDEAQYIKNPNAIVTRTAKGLKADFKLLATGTPVENSLRDFWCLMDTCAPGFLGSWQEFREAYIQPILLGKNKPEIKRLIGTKLRRRVGKFMLRRTKEASLKGLPQKTVWVGTEPAEGEKFFETLRAKMPKPQIIAYNKVIEKVRDNRGNQESNSCTGVLGALNALRNISIHPNLVTDPKEEEREPLIIEHSGKLVAVFELLSQLRRKGEKCIIFIMSRRAQALVAAGIQARFGVQVDIVNGDTATTSMKQEKTRKGIIDRFQEEKGFGVIILSPVATGVGLTVTEANNVIHLERHWNPAKERQATDRVYRIGQKKNVNIYLPIATHSSIISFDERLNQLLRNKIDLSEAVVTIEGVDEKEMSKVFDAC